MTAREAIADKLWWSVPGEDSAESKTLTGQMLDAYRDEVLREAAEKIRAERLVAPEGYTVRSSYLDAWNDGRNEAAHLIDPDVT